MAGLGSNGFEIKRQPEIVADIEADQKTVFGADLILDPSSPDAQFNGLMSNQLATLWQLGLDVYSGLDPRTANGLMLDRISAINGISRQQPTPSVAVIDLFGTNGSVIPQGTIFSSPDIPNIKFTLDAEVTISGTGSISGEVTADTLGATLIAPDTITKIDTPVSGLTSVTNPSAGQTGIDQETDEELRKRRALSISLGSVSMIESIFSAVANITGVEKTKMYENITNGVDTNGLPAHSIEVLVKGGAESDISKAIADNRSVGCDLFGTTTSPYVDRNNFTHDIKFSRPVEVPIFVQITASKLPNWDINTNTDIQSAIVGYGNGTGGVFCSDFLGYQISEDVYGTQLIYALASITSISITQILVGIASPAGLQLQPIAYNELATFLEANIEIIYV